jgi:hypothetical protein
MSSGQRDRLKYFRATASSNRRKWSDWSECSEACTRTRHRLNCDDLTGGSGGRASNSSDSKNGAAGAHGKQVLPAGLKSTGPQLQLRQLLAATAVSSEPGAAEQRPQALAAKQVAAKEQSLDDEQDYADEGDEDDEGDSCAQVEPSRTFEEQACSGGQCKQPALGDIFRPFAPPTNHHQLHQSASTARSNSQRLSQQQPRPRPKGEYIGRRPRPPTS